MLAQGHQQATVFHVQHPFSFMLGAVFLPAHLDTIPPQHRYANLVHQLAPLALGQLLIVLYVLLHCFFKLQMESDRAFNRAL